MPSGPSLDADLLPFSHVKPFCSASTEAYVRSYVVVTAPPLAGPILSHILSEKYGAFMERLEGQN
jgi:hypothetical protein